jgi:hypothetical protein
MSTPSDFAEPEEEFKSYKKLDDLPPRGAKLNSKDDVMKAMAVLHRMIHAQAKAYGGKNSKLLPVGIAEQAPTFKTFLKLIDAERR